MKTLPPNFEIVKHPKTGFRFVRLPSGHLVPNTGEAYHTPNPTDEQIIANFEVFLKRVCAGNYGPKLKKQLAGVKVEG